MRPRTRLRAGSARSSGRAPPSVRWGTSSAAITAGVIIALLILGILIVRSLAGPITRLTGSMRQIADGQFDVELAGKNRKDEIGGMVRAVEVFRQNGLRISSMTEEEKRAEERRQRERIARWRLYRTPVEPDGLAHWGGFKRNLFPKTPH